MNRGEHRKECLKTMAVAGERTARAHEIACQEEGAIDWNEVMAAAFDSLHPLAMVIWRDIENEPMPIGEIGYRVVDSDDLTKPPEGKP